VPGKRLGDERHYKLIEFFENDGRKVFDQTTATIFYGQCGEDLEIYVDFISKDLDIFTDTGTYIEIGASNGVMYSNSKFFEDELGFSGVLIEPLPKFFEILSRTRPNNKLYNCAVSEKGGPVEFYEDPGGWVSGMKNTMSSHHYDQWYKDEPFQDNVIEVNSIPMSEIMNEAGLEYVDIFSIDVEGGEYEVLSTIDWNIPIYLFIIELAKDEKETQKDINCRNLMKDKGYRFHKRVGVSEIWYDPEYLNRKIR
jgi:FkbM family methyltransferase